MGRGKEGRVGFFFFSFLFKKNLKGCVISLKRRIFSISKKKNTIIF